MAPQPATPSQAMTRPILPHSLYEDAYGIASGVLFVAVGVAMLNAAHLVTGGIAGIALLLSYVAAHPPGVLFALINLPFFLVGYFLMGWRFTVKSMIGSVLIMGMLAIMPHVYTIGYIHPAGAALIGGTFCGMGILSFARHDAGVGGTGILTLWIMQRYGINAGRTQMMIDGVIMLASLLVVAPILSGWSALSAVAMSTVVLTWHRPGRYVAS